VRGKFKFIWNLKPGLTIWNPTVTHLDTGRIGQRENSTLAAYVSEHSTDMHLESYTPGTCQYVPVRTDLYRPVL
jgi:hypothetical protein